MGSRRSFIVSSSSSFPFNKAMLSGERFFSASCLSCRSSLDLGSRTGSRYAEARDPTAQQVTELQSDVEGEVVLVSKGWDAAALLKNGLRSGRDPEFLALQPAVYLRAASEADVVAGIEFALTHNLEVSFRAGGHHVGGVALCSQGMTIDMRDLKDVKIDKASSTARFQAGITAYELSQATQEYGLHYRVAHIGTVGVAGFTLGGGQGWGGLAALQIFKTTWPGLQVIGLDMVNVWEFPEQELTIRRIDESSEPELFAAMRGAGSMLGAVVAFHAQLQPIPEGGNVSSSAAMWPLDQAQHAYDALSDYISGRQDENIANYVEQSLSYVTIPKLGPVAMVTLTDWSPDNGASAFLDGWADVAQALGAKPMKRQLEYLDQINGLTGQLDFPGVTNWAIGFYIAQENMPAAAEIIADGYANATTPQSVILSGAIPPANESRTEMVYSWQGYQAVYIYAVWTRTPGGAQVDGDAEHVAWAESVASRLEPLAAGHDINVITFQEASDTESCFSTEKWAQIVAAKARYDPKNTFRELYFSYVSK